MTRRLSFLALALTACQPNVGDVVTGSIAGSVVKGPVNGASVVAYAVDKDGRRRVEVGSATTTDAAEFIVDVGGHFGPTLVCANGGTFTEEATGGLVNLGANELCALIDDQQLASSSASVTITPLTTLHAGLTGCLVESGVEADLKSASTRASSRLNAFLSAATPGFDIRTTSVFDATKTVAPSLTADVWHGLLLAGFSESARQVSLASELDPGVRVTSATLTTELVRDIDDGRCVFDGAGPAGVALAQGNIALSSNTLRGAPQGLALSIERFLDGERNVSGISSEDVKDLTRELTSHESDIFPDSESVSAPLVAIVEPIAGPVAGRPVIRVSASDVVGIESIELVAPQDVAETGETSCALDNECDLVAELNTALFDSGPLTITARATNVAGVSSEASVDVVINNDIPLINVIAPSDGVASGTVPVLAAATSDVGIAEFSLDVPGVTFLPACAPPVTTNCDREPDPTLIDILWDTSTATEGAVALTFRATDTASNAAFAVVNVDVDNVPVGTIAGVVELGFPVVGAAVSVYEMTNGVRGALIGSTTTDDEGRYQVENADFAGTIEVVATGGGFEDSSTGQPLTLRAGQELSTATDIELGEAAVININAWTTLAKKRALVTQAESPSFSAALTFNSNLFATHLLRPGALSLVESASANLLEEDPAPSDSAAILALAHAGLSRVAAQTSIDVGGAPGQVTLVDLLDVLLADLNDTILDGTDNGTALFLDQQFLAADADVLRMTLAIGIDNFIEDAPFRDNGVVVLDVARNNSTITSAALVGPGLLYDDLALDRSVLFPADVPVSPFDQDPPIVELSFAAPNEDAAFGASLAGVIAIVGTASDASGLAAFDILSPDVIDLFSPVADIRAEIDGSHAPNQVDVLARCGIELGDPPFALPDPSRHVCLCVEAVDALENVTHDVQCFTRPRPVVTTDAGSFVGPAQGGINVTAIGSFHLEACSAQVDQQGVILGAANVTATGNECSLFVPFATPLLAGPVRLDVDVTEIGGAVSRSSFSSTADLTAPVVSITAPSAGSFRASPPLIGALATDANLVSVTADVVTNAGPVVLGLVGTVIAPNGAVTFPAFADTAPDGLRTITVTATDAAGNATSVQRNYTKDTVAPVLSNLTAADGNALSHYQLTATSAFVASSQCSDFPFAGCVFNIVASTPTQDVDLRTTATSAETYRRWQHLAGTLVNPSTSNTPAAENRAPTLRLKTEAGTSVEARIDATCPSSATQFENRSRGTFVANSVGLVDVPIVDGQSVTASPTLLRNQTGAATLCLSMRATDQAGNKGGVLNHFFRYEATPAPLFILWNDGAYDPAAFQEDVEAFDDGDDNDVLSGNGQGAAGRVIAHAYLVSPSTTTNYNYVYSLDDGPAPSIVVSHREVAHISKQRAFNWCNTQDGNDTDTLVDDEDDDLVNPDDIVANESGSPPNNPTWSGSNLDKVSSSASWALFTPTGGSLLSASATMEHRANISGEADTTFSHGPRESYPTDTNTVELGQLFTFTIPLNTVTLEAWNYNTVTGMPGSLVDAGESVSFTAGGGSNATRHRLLLVRAPVPQNAITLKSASALNGQLGTIGFNDTCTARNASGTLIPQMFALPADHWVIADASVPSGAEPAAPRRLLWVKTGTFTECKGTSTNDCRYGRYFDDYVDATWAWPSGRAIEPQGKIAGDISSASFVPQPTLTIPAGESRELEQEQ